MSNELNDEKFKILIIIWSKGVLLISIMLKCIIKISILNKFFLSYSYFLMIRKNIFYCARYIYESSNEVTDRFVIDILNYICIIFGLNKEYF